MGQAIESRADEIGNRRICTPAVIYHLAAQLETPSCWIMRLRSMNNDRFVKVLTFFAANQVQA